jgi:aminoglycoside/choline kinase family phosphotransferase
MESLRLPDYEIFSEEFTDKCGELISTERLSGGSDREFFRLKGSLSNAVLLVDPVSKRRESYFQTAQYLKRTGVAVPEIFANLWHISAILMEDVGGSSLEDEFKSHADFSLYSLALDSLLFLQSSPFKTSLPVIVEKNVFDFERLLNESGQFFSHFIGDRLGIAIEDETIEMKG